MHSHYLHNFLEATDWELPLDLSEVFGNDKSVFVEIGFGSGEFLRQLAFENKDSNYLAIELSMISSQKLLKVLKKNGLENVRVLLVDANFALREILPTGEVEGVYMNFPCPWPKKRHSARRLNDESFIIEIARILKFGGFFQLYTDSKEFADQLYSSADSTNLFTVAEVEVNPREGVNTRYERKWLRAQRDIYRLIVKRGETSLENGVEGGKEMPHKWLEEEINASKLTSLLNRTIIEEKLLVKYLRVYKALESDGYLVETIAVDDDYRQSYYIALVRKDSKWLIQLDGQTRPFRTPAVKFSVRKLAELLESR